jgi:hypothetical protein
MYTVAPGSLSGEVGSCARGDDTSTSADSSVVSIA